MSHIESDFLDGVALVETLEAEQMYGDDVMCIVQETQVQNYKIIALLLLAVHVPRSEAVEKNNSNYYF